jgi:hypothetical protein
VYIRARNTGKYPGLLLLGPSTNEVIFRMLPGGAGARRTRFSCYAGESNYFTETISNLCAVFRLLEFNWKVFCGRFLAVWFLNFEVAKVKV